MYDRVGDWIDQYIIGDFLPNDIIDIKKKIKNNIVKKIARFKLEVTT